MPKVATELLPPDSSKLLLSPDKFIVRSDAKMQAWHEEHSSFPPYWDPTLSSSREAQLELYRLLASKGLIVLRKPIKSCCGIFSACLEIKRKGHPAYHRRSKGKPLSPPPQRAFLGSGSAIGELQVSGAVGGFAEVEAALPEEGGTRKR